MASAKSTIESSSAGLGFTAPTGAVSRGVLLAARLPTGDMLARFVSCSPSPVIICGTGSSWLVMALPDNSLSDGAFTWGCVLNRDGSGLGGVAVLPLMLSFRSDKKICGEVSFCNTAASSPTGAMIPVRWALLSNGVLLA